MPKTLKQNVFVDGRWYGPDYGSADLPSKVEVDNPGAFEDPGTGVDLRFRADDFAPDLGEGATVPNLAALARLSGGTGSTVVTIGTTDAAVDAELDNLDRDTLLTLAASRGVEVKGNESEATLRKRLRA